MESKCDTNCTQAHEHTHHQGHTKPHVFFVLGGPGSGKGTLCKNLVERNKFIHLSAGDLLREEMGRKSDNAALINDFISKGQIVPVAITISLLKAAMHHHGWEKSRFLIDGFPRNEDNVNGWNEVIKEEADVVGIIYIKCSEDTMTQRILKRGESSGRTDDKEEVIKKRFVTYNNETFPIIEKKRQEGFRIFEIDGEKAPEQVYESCMSQIQSFL